MFKIKKYMNIIIANRRGRKKLLENYFLGEMVLLDFFYGQ